MLSFFYFDFSKALDHANYIKTLGYKATVGRNNGAEKYHVRIMED